MPNPGISWPGIEEKPNIAAITNMAGPQVRKKITIFAMSRYYNQPDAFGYGDKSIKTKARNFQKDNDEGQESAMWFKALCFGRIDDPQKVSHI